MFITFETLETHFAALFTVGFTCNRLLAYVSYVASCFNKEEYVSVICVTELGFVLSVTSVIERASEEKKYYPAAFLDVSRGFVKVCLSMSWAKLFRETILTAGMISFPKKFGVSHNEDISTFKPISAEIPQGSIPGPLVHLLYTTDISRSNIK